jgi:Icc-related predicted phosphoesterase
MQVPEVSRCIFNLHDPPVDSSLDVCARLDDGDPPRHILKGGRPVMHNAGSTAVRRAIEKYHPVLSLHGHIHESPGVVRIGKTLCINPGSEYSEGILRGAIVNLQDGHVQGYQLTTG